MNGTSELGWDAAVWKAIDDAVVAEMGRVRSAQKVLPATPVRQPSDRGRQRGHQLLGPLDPRGPDQTLCRAVPGVHASPRAGDERGASSGPAHTLAQMAAKSIALGEDTVIFQGTGGKLPAGVKAEGMSRPGARLLGEANPKDANDNDPFKVTAPIVVPRPARTPVRRAVRREPFHRRRRRVSPSSPPRLRRRSSRSSCRSRVRRRLRRVQRSEPGDDRRPHQAPRRGRVPER